MITMHEILEGFQEELQRQDMSLATVRNYLNDVHLFGQWREASYGEEFVPSSIVQREIIEYRSYLLTIKSSSPCTVNRKLASLSKFFEWCLATKQCKINPCLGVKSIHISEPIPRALDVKALRRLLREVHVHGSVRDIAIVELLAGSAIRVGELVMLSASDAEISERRGILNIRHGKGRASRKIPINSDVRKALTDWIAVRPATNSNYLFNGQRGEGMTTNGIWRTVKKYSQLAGIPDMRTHDLRHTVLTRLVREFGTDFPTVARISGHRNLKTLMRYAQPTGEDLSVAMERLAFASQ